MPDAQNNTFLTTATMIAATAAEATTARNDAEYAECAAACRALPPIPADYGTRRLAYLMSR